jgi:glyoxylase I family protein
VSDIEATVAYLQFQGIQPEPIRLDELTGRRFTFFEDPDHLPLEIYEC